MTHTLTFNDVHPTLLVSANRRIHWAKRSATSRHWRHLAYVTAWGQRIPAVERAHVVVTVRFPDRRRRDVANLHPLLAKPIVDGLVDAGVLPDDSDDYLIGPDLRRDPERGPLRVVVEITPQLEGGM